MKTFEHFFEFTHLYQDATQLIDAGVWHFDPSNQRLHWSSDCYDLHEAPPDFIVSLDNMLNCYPAEAQVQLRQAFDQLLQHGVPFDLTLPLLTLKQNRRWVRIAAKPRPLQEGDIQHLVGVVQNVEAYKAREEALTSRMSQLHYLAHHDPLTNLPNRLLFSDRLQHALTRSSRDKSKVAVLLLDLDGFKAINDNLGHDVGDQLIQVVAKRLRKHLRVQDTAARLGGDEFVVILEAVTRLKEVTVVADKILRAIRRPVRVGIHEISSAASMGISLYPSDGNSADTLVKHADIALYRAKELGKNNYQFFTADLNRRALRLAQLEDELREAIALHQFVLYYQPIFGADCEQIIGAEALVRWQHPTRGLLPPAEFLEAAEETGLITPLGQWVAQDACQHFTGWLRDGHAMEQLTLNISGVQLRHNVQRNLERLLTQYGLAPSSLMLDVSEQVVVKEVEGLPHLIQELRDLGVQLAVDNFGTGHTCLPHLKRLPLTTLKIDRRFVQNIPRSREDQAIVSSLIAMAHELGLQVLAEGVDHESQLEFLRARHCDYYQGNHLAEPLPAEAFAHRLKAGSMAV